MEKNSTHTLWLHMNSMDHEFAFPFPRPSTLRCYINVELIGHRVHLRGEPIEPIKTSRIGRKNEDLKIRGFDEKYRIDGIGSTGNGLSVREYPITMVRHRNYPTIWAPYVGDSLNVSPGTFDSARFFIRPPVFLSNVLSLAMLLL